MIAIENNQPVYLIGGFGGVAHLLADIIEKKTTFATMRDVAMSDDNYKELYKWCVEHGMPIKYAKFGNVKISDLNNGLSYEDNKTLFHSVDIMEIVSLVLKGLKEIK